MKEYWIVDPNNKSVEVYHLVEGKYQFAGSYKVSEEYDEENKFLNNEIKVSIFEDLIVDVRNVFKWWIKPN